MNKNLVPADLLAKPSRELRVCVFCGMPGGWRYDRVGRAYFSCPFCRTRLFLHSHAGIAGTELLHELVFRAGVQRFRQLVQQRAARSLPKAPVVEPRRAPPPPRKAAQRVGAK